jgi:hypothetical protein
LALPRDRSFKTKRNKGREERREQRVESRERQKKLFHAGFEPFWRFRAWFGETLRMAWTKGAEIE